MSTNGEIDTAESVVIVVPCFNEADRLDEATFLDYASDHSNVRFLFVNDGSTDATAAVIQPFYATPRLVPLSYANSTAQLRQGRSRAIGSAASDGRRC